MTLQNVGEAAILNILFRFISNPFSTPSGVKMALLTQAGSGTPGTPPNDALAAGDPLTNEVTTGSYARGSVTFPNAATEGNPSSIANGTLSPTHDITFPTATAAWTGNGGANAFIGAWAICDTNATTASRRAIWAGPFDTTKTVATNDSVRVVGGALILQCD